MAFWTKKLDVSSLREPIRKPWYQLTPLEKLEDLKERSDQEDRRLDQVEQFHGGAKKILWAIVLAVAGVLGKEIAQGWRLTSVPPAAQPTPSGGASTAPDRVPLPTPPRP